MLTCGVFKMRMRLEGRKQERNNVEPGASQLADHAPKRSAGSQVLDQLFNTAQVATQQLLLLVCGKSDSVAAAICATALPIGSEGSDKLARAALEHGRDGVALISARDRGRFGHEVEVQKLDELEFDLAGGGPRFEERGHR